MSFRILQGDALARLSDLPDESVHCCVTSPPYWSLRDYECAGQIGLESSPWEYVDRLVGVFAALRRVLRKDGTLWVNMGDSYISQRGGKVGENSALNGSRHNAAEYRKAHAVRRYAGAATGFKHKDLVGQGWILALALQADGWWLRDEIIWHKPNTMPSSARDRTTRAHERIFVLTRSSRYYWNRAAAKEPYQAAERSGKFPAGWEGGPGRHDSYRVPPRAGRYNDHHRNADIPPASAVPGAPKHSGLRRSGNIARKYLKTPTNSGSHMGRSIPWEESDGRNMRSVWRINVAAFVGEFYAAFPPEIPRRCIEIGSPRGGGNPRPVLRRGDNAPCGRPSRSRRDRDRTQPEDRAPGGSSRAL